MKLLRLLLCSLSLTLAAGQMFAGNQNSAKPVSKDSSGTQASGAPKDSEVERGRYLVEEVARCVDCHTPRDSNGALDHSAWLRGATVWIRPVQSKDAWAMYAPTLAGFAYSDKQGQDVLERGIGTNGNPIQPPMHAYHLHHADAVAIIAYLRSVR